ncbi:hypothetical protein HMPREF0397_0546 [Fusobacterium nucleatum subsp. nucleatum ATCC 23726]|uniref:Uncharacterized protein n=1 Tax=Fusobacterium nucleatum subsp. nucleatum (strain ATCC 23726 / VPI 4351) TaxID=525283 RepID=D5RBG1_FUSN2|nr:hypothetical protein HMPREF0397_0546 [Fusobacterium nucleatum subsp. nucleatum ATCC 23726]
MLQQPLSKFKSLRSSEKRNINDYIKFLASTFEVLINIEDSNKFKIKKE